MKYIDKVGIELEGGWLRPLDGWPSFFRKVDFVVKTDSSVELDEGTIDTRIGKNWDCSKYLFDVEQCSYFSAGRDPSLMSGMAEVVEAEFNSNPMSNRQVINGWLNTFYPTFVNDTCGLHVHISFKSPAFYALLATKKFNTYFRAKMKRWGTKNIDSPEHEFWKRYWYHNTFCSLRFDAHNQLKGHGDRYSQLNFCAYRSHGTIENRLFPMFEKKELAISAVNEYIDCVESFIYVEKDKFFARKKENVIRVCV